MSLLVDYLEEEGFIRHCSVTTCSEYYQKQDIKIRISDHRSNSKFDLDIQKIKNQKNEYLIYVKNFPHPITVKGITELRQAIKWFVIFKNLYDAQDKFKKAQPSITTVVDKPKTVTVNKEKIKDIVQISPTKPIDCSEIPKEIIKIEVSDWEKIRTSRNALINKKDFYCQVLLGDNYFRSLKTSKIQYNKTDTAANLFNLNRYICKLATVIKTLTNIKLSKIIIHQVSRDIFYNSLILNKFQNFLEVIQFLLYTHEKLVKNKSKQEDLTLDSITENIKFIRNKITIDSPTSYSVTKTPERVITIDQSDIDVISPLGSDSEKDVLLQVPITSRGVSWKTKMQVFIMRDFPKYNSFSAFTKNYIWDEIFKYSKLTKYQDFHDILVKCSDKNYSLESIKSNFEDLKTSLENI